MRIPMWLKAYSLIKDFGKLWAEPLNPQSSSIHEPKNLESTQLKGFLEYPY